jgi:hypothetical protein
MNRHNRMHGTRLLVTSEAETERTLFPRMGTKCRLSMSPPMDVIAFDPESARAVGLA